MCRTRRRTSSSARFAVPHAGQASASAAAALAAELSAPPRSRRYRPCREQSSPAQSGMSNARAKPKERYARPVSEERLPKPGEVADDEALSGSDEAQAHVRRWWRLVPRILTRPTEVFVALRDDEEVDVDARSEPILAIVIVAGMAGILLTPAWATLIDDESLDWIVIAVITFIGGLFYGAAGYFLLGARRVAGRARGRSRGSRAGRPGRSSASPPCRSRSRSSSPCPRCSSPSATTGFSTGGSDDGTGRIVVLSIATRARALVARVAGARPADDLRAAVAGRRRRVGARRGDHRGVRRAAVVFLTASASQRGHAVPGIR